MTEQKAVYKLKKLVLLLSSKLYISEQQKGTKIFTADTRNKLT